MVKIISQMAPMISAPYGDLVSSQQNIVRGWNVILLTKLWLRGDGDRMLLPWSHYVIQNSSLLDWSKILLVALKKQAAMMWITHREHHMARPLGTCRNRRPQSYYCKHVELVGFWMWSLGSNKHMILEQDPESQMKSQLWLTLTAACGVLSRVSLLSHV